MKYFTIETAVQLSIFVINWNIVLQCEIVIFWDFKESCITCTITKLQNANFRRKCPERNCLSILYSSLSAFQVNWVISPRKTDLKPKIRYNANLIKISKV